MKITTTITPLCVEPRLAMPSAAAAFGRARVWSADKRNQKHVVRPGVPVWSPPHC
jgi:hypothetical protein